MGHVRMTSVNDSGCSDSMSLWLTVAVIIYLITSRTPLATLVHARPLGSPVAAPENNTMVGMATAAARAYDGSPVAEPPPGVQGSGGADGILVLEHNFLRCPEGSAWNISEIALHTTVCTVSRKCDTLLFLGYGIGNPRYNFLISELGRRSSSVYYFCY